MRILAVLIFLIYTNLFAETRLFPQQESQDLKTQEVAQEISKDAQNANAVESKEQPQEVEQIQQEAQPQAQENQNLANFSLVKNVYLEMLNPPFNVLYVGQIIEIDLKMLIFSEHTSIKTEFLFANELEKKSVEILNANDNWHLMEDSSFTRKVYIKIKQPNYTIPQIKVEVDTKDGVASESIASSSSKAVKLERKGDFSQVLAHNLEIVDTKITNYDENNNLIVLQLQSQMGNLFDFHLEPYAQQGIESKSGDFKESMAFYYVIVKKTENPFSFDYFNLSTSKYESLQVQNIAVENRVSTQSDIKPKNNIQFFKIAVVLAFAILFFGLYLYKRRIIFVLLGVFALGILVYLLTLKTSATLKANTTLRIQPTFNSTTILVTKEALEVRILGNRGDYFKVILEDERIGWVKKDDFQN